MRHMSATATTDSMLIGTPNVHITQARNFSS